MEGQYVSCYMAEKAGMGQIDKRAIAEKIEKMTAGTPKAIHEKQLNDRRNIQIAQMVDKAAQLPQEKRLQIKKQWAKTIDELNFSRNLDRYWAHFDFDMFYVACQLLQKPDLNDKPCAVGGQNSVLCTANYQARKYGVRSALPTFIAKQLCPQLILIEPNFTKYKHYSGIFRKVLQRFDPQLQSHGLDEAYVDLTDFLREKSIQEIGQIIKSIRTQIFKETGLTVSCGVGANKLLAKLASQQKKPNDQFILLNDSQAIIDFMKNKKIRKIPGIGPVNEYYLKGLGIQTSQNILDSLDSISVCFSKLTTEYFVSAALGLGQILHQHRQQKSVGKSQTFRCTDNQQFLDEKLKDLCEQVSMELRQLGFFTLNAVLSFQNLSFQKKDKTFNLPQYSDKPTDLYKICIQFLRSSVKGKIRLLGVRCTALIRTEEFKKQQLQTFLDNKEKRTTAKTELGQQVQAAKDLINSEMSEKGKYMCPICDLIIQCKGNITFFNRHVDKCLSRIAGGQKLQTVEQQTPQKFENSKKSAGPKIPRRNVPKKPSGNNSLMSFLKK